MKMKEFPKVYGSATQSKHGSTALFTTEMSCNPFDATAPGMTPKLALERANYAADAINERPSLLWQRDELARELRATEHRCLELIERAKTIDRRLIAVFNSPPNDCDLGETTRLGEITRLLEQLKRNSTALANCEKEIKP